MQKGFKKRFCKSGHDTLICGRIPTGKCRECGRERTQRYRINLRKTDPIRWRKVSKEHNWKQSGICNSDNTPFTILDYDRLYQIQQGRCALCSRHQSEMLESLSADHDHETGQIRGLLCRQCNSRINILDGGEFTTKVLAYLKIKVVKEK